MKKNVKGQFGYLKAQKNKYIWIVSLGLAAVFGIFFTARFALGTNQNIFSIVAALLCFPVARAAVNLVMLCRAKTCSRKAYDAISPHTDGLAGAYDLYLTTYDKNFALSHAAVCGKSVIAYTEDPACAQKAGEDHIRRSMQKSGFHGYGVKIFDHLGPYLDRMDMLRENGETDAEKKADGEILQLLEQIAL